MMNFRGVIKDAIIDILEKNSKNCFVVNGHQRQTSGATEHEGFTPLVTVYYASGEFPKNSSSLSGDVQHECTYRIELIVATSARADLSTLNDPNADNEAKANALETSQKAGAVADAKLDELADLVYQILMAPANKNLGLPKFPRILSSRWIERIQKDEPGEQGELIVLTASLWYTLQVLENVVSEIPKVPASGSVQQSIDITIDGDEDAKAGVETKND